MRETRPSGSVEGVMSNRDPYSDCSSWPVSAVLRWVDGSYLSFVEPRLIGNLDVVSVRVADVCREVVGTPFGPKARFLV